jgi:hypothetical protein
VRSLKDSDAFLPEVVKALLTQVNGTAAVLQCVPHRKLCAARVDGRVERGCLRVPQRRIGFELLLRQPSLSD